MLLVNYSSFVMNLWAPKVTPRPLIADSTNIHHVSLPVILCDYLRPRHDRGTDRVHSFRSVASGNGGTTQDGGLQPGVFRHSFIPGSCAWHLGVLLCAASNKELSPLKAEKGHTYVQPTSRQLIGVNIYPNWRRSYPNWRRSFPNCRRGHLNWHCRCLPNTILFCV